jgi:hypothetical protein
LTPQKINPSSTSLSGKLSSSSRTKKQKLGCATTRIVSCICRWFSWEKSIIFFQHLANFSQNSINTNKVEVGDSVFETKIVKTGVKLGAKFINKMIEHVEDNLIPNDIPAFAKSLFVKQTAGGAITLATAKSEATKNQEVVAASGESGNKQKYNGHESGGKKKSRKEFSDKSLKMGLFHVKQGTPAVKALPKKDMLKDEICLDFCLHGKSVTSPINSANMESITQIGKRPQRQQTSAFVSYE